MLRSAGIAVLSALVSAVACVALSSAAVAAPVASAPTVTANNLNWD